MDHHDRPRARTHTRASRERTARRDIHPLWFLGATLRSALRMPGPAVGSTLRTLVNQVRFTAVHAVPLMVFTAALFGVPLMLSVAPLTAELGVADAVDRVLVTVVLQELGPIVAALMVVVRSGTAVVAELAAARVTGEREALEALGVDTLQYYVLPRMVAFAVSVALLTVFFDALLLGALALGRHQAGDAGAFATMLRSTVSGADVVVTLLKAMVIGAGVAVFPAMEGMEAGDDPVTIPVAVSRGTQQAFLWTFGATAIFATIRWLA